MFNVRCPIELHHDSKSDEQLAAQENDGLRGRDRARCEWSEFGALDAAVEIAIPQVVDGATGAAHDECAHGHHCGQTQIRQVTRGSSECDTPQTRKKQQPSTHRLIHAGQKQIGMDGRREQLEYDARREWWRRIVCIRGQRKR
jgi:hypothetical protein